CGARANSVRTASIRMVRKVRYDAVRLWSHPLPDNPAIMVFSLASMASHELFDHLRGFRESPQATVDHSAVNEPRPINQTSFPHAWMSESTRLQAGRPFMFHLNGTSAVKAPRTAQARRPATDSRASRLRAS